MGGFTGRSVHTITVPAGRSVPTPAGGREVERRLKDMLSTDQDVRQQVKRKASVEVPSTLLKLSPLVKVQLTFTDDHGEEVVLAALLFCAPAPARLPAAPPNSFTARCNSAAMVQMSILFALRDE